MAGAHVQVVLGGQTIPEGLEAALRRVGATASFGPLSEVLRSGLKPTADAVVVVAGEDTHAGFERLQAFFNRVAAQPRGTLVLQPEGSNGRRPTHPAAVPVSFSDQASAEELAVRITTMIELRPSLESLHRGTTARSQLDEQLAEKYRQQLRQASQVQRELLPHALPRCDGISFALVYRPMDYVSGDIYDVRRLDHEHVAIALVDTQGHGICAALLSIFIKRALREEETNSGRARPRTPDAVLRRLNEELLEADLTESQFAAAVYVVFNTRTRRGRLARGGVPYPILRRADGRGEILRPAGPVIGVVPDASFAVESFKLAPGDSLVLYTDGLEQIAHSAEPAPSGVPTTLAPDHALTATRWYDGLRRDGVAPALEQLEQRHDTLRRLGRALDDLTVLAVNIDP